MAGTRDRPAGPGRVRPRGAGARTALPGRLRARRVGRPARLVRPRRTARRRDRRTRRAGLLPRRAGPGTAGPAPRPDPATPAPVRFLPAFDNAILGYHDRGRIIDDAHRGLSVTGARVVLVDGRVSATWTAKDGAVTVTPLRALSRADRADVTEEGRRLASFLSDGDGDRVRLDASPG
ncbi:DNA glycosylase AlkZ-like family protein [Actinomadura yumaensis]|uniref:DNA glycosylase AlkZ-like family protein n=1 Tax=Actinomadura yumaensis TaxID=111807 RepID=UPI0036211845